MCLLLDQMAGSLAACLLPVSKRATHELGWHQLEFPPLQQESGAGTAACGHCKCPFCEHAKNLFYPAAGVGEQLETAALDVTSTCTLHLQYAMLQGSIEQLKAVAPEMSPARTR